MMKTRKTELEAGLNEESSKKINLEQEERELILQNIFLPKILGWDHAEKLIVDRKLMYISLVQHPKIEVGA